MKWEQPAFDEIRMDAEIGSYQNDFDRERDPIITKAPEPIERAVALETAGD
jgi:hypothetical protein